MTALPLGVGGCAACMDGRAHPDRVLHQHMPLRLSRLDEPQRRWSAAVAANRLGHGGVRRAAGITGLDEPTIRRGQQQVAGSLADAPLTRQRRAGGGRPPVDKGSRPSCPRWRRCSRPRPAAIR